jgi:CRISPR-associated protein Cas1
MTGPASDPRPPIDEHVLYVTTQGTQIGARQNQYVVRDVRDSESRNDEHEQNRSNDGVQRLGEYPVRKVDTINVFGRGVDVTTATVATAANQETVINFFTTNGRFRGKFTPEDTSVAVLHRQQHALTDDVRREVARRFVLGKVVNARRYLERKGISVSSDSPLMTAPRRIQTTDSLDVLRGVEGEAARQYFDLYDRTLADDWTMDGRSRRPPGDRVNSLLSLTYTFLQRECEGALRQVNLDPYVGIFHGMRHGRPALALDLLEEFRRAFADPFVARLINRGTMSREDFTAEHRLGDSVFDQFVGKFDEYMSEELSHDWLERTLTRREVVRLQANLLRKRITGELEAYPPFEVTR